MHVPNIALLLAIFRKMQATGNNHAPQRLFRCSRIGAGAIIFGSRFFSFPTANSKLKAQRVLNFVRLWVKKTVFDAKERNFLVIVRLERSFAESVLDFCQAAHFVVHVTQANGCLIGQ